jgi:hypothetical protein
MSSQIFKKPVPNEILFDLLQKVSANKDNNIDNYYLLNKTCFKQMVYHNYLEDFRDTIKEYYHKSKLHYIERKLDYNKFITIIRQLCSFNKISYTSKIVYNNSTYDIVYYIYK